MSKFIDKCKSLLSDPPPELDESHAKVRYGMMYEPEIIPDLPPAQDTLEQRFAAYDKAHPEILQAIYARASRLAFIQHKKRLSMKRIFEDLWDLMQVLGDEYGLDNTWTGRYTDLLIEQHPEFTHLFERRARAKGKMKRVYCK